jgi:uncharacterized protein (TIGR02646 family)
MIQLRKRRPEPGALRQRRMTPGLSGWDLGPAREPVRSALDADQFGLCAYCNRRLGTGWRVEHWMARSVAPDRTYEWENLLGVCDGDSGRAYLSYDGPAEGAGLIAHHCDVARGNRSIQLNPYAASNVADRVHHARSGKLVGRDDDATRDISTLNLNQWRLVEARARLRAWASQRLANSKSFAALQAFATVVDGSGHLPPHVGVIREWLPRWGLRDR